MEDKASGKSLRQELVPAGVSVIPVTPLADKLTRAYSVTPLFEEGRVFIAAGEEWADDVIAGCAEYPNGDFSDVVDTLSQAIAWMAQNPAYTERELDALLEGVQDSNFVNPKYKIRQTSLLTRDVFRFGRNSYYQ